MDIEPELEQRVALVTFPALFVALGMIVGSYLFAEFSGVLNRTIEKWGERGELLLPQIMRFFAWQGVLTAV